MRRDSRGFSLLTVLLAMLLLAVAGSAAIAVGTMDVGTAEARANYTQALAAADAGLQHFSLMASPSMIEPAFDYAGSRAGNGPESFIWLPGHDLDGDGNPDMEGRYRVWGIGPGPVPESGIAAVHGQVVRGGAVVSNAVLQVVLQVRCRGGGTGQTGGNPRGDGAMTRAECARTPDAGGPPDLTPLL